MDDKERHSLAKYLSEFLKESFFETLSIVPEGDLMITINRGIKEWQIDAPSCSSKQTESKI